MVPLLTSVGKDAPWPEDDLILLVLTNLALNGDCSFCIKCNYDVKNAVIAGNGEW